MEKVLKKVDQIIDELNSKLTIVDDTLKSATPDQLRALLKQHEEIELLGNRLENKNRSSTQLVNSINRNIARALE